jgi:hypothetical protein
MKWQEAEENCIMRSSIIYSSPNIIRISSRRMRWAGRSHGGDEKYV